MFRTAGTERPTYSSKHMITQEHKEKVDGETASRTIHEINSTKFRLEELSLNESGWSQKKSEGFLMVARDKELRSTAIEVTVDKQQGEVMCRMCSDREETVGHPSRDCRNII